MTTQKSDSLTSSEGDFLKAFLKVDDRVQDLMKGNEGQGLYNKIQNLKSDENVAGQLQDILNHILEPMKELLIKQDWYNWSGFICWDYFREKPIVLITACSENLSQTRYEFARDLYKQENIFNRGNGFQDILALTFNKGVQSVPILLEWKRPGSVEEENPFKDIHTCSVNQLNEALNDEECKERYEDLLSFVDTEYNRKANDEPTYQLFAARINDVSDILLRKDRRIIASETDSLKLRLFEQISDATFTEKELLNLVVWNRCFDNTWQYIFYVPGAFLNNMGVGGIVLASNRLPGYTEYRLIEQTINRVFSQLAIVFGAVESRSKARVETIRAPYHEFSTFSNAIQAFINSVDEHPGLLEIISGDSHLTELHERAKFYNEYLNIVLSYFKHRETDGWFLLKQTKLPTNNIRNILNSMYKPALGYTILQWQDNRRYGRFISSHKNQLINSIYNINDNSRLSSLRIKGKWQTAVFVGCFILTCNMLEHGIKAMSKRDDLINPWHELAFVEDPKGKTFSFRNVYSDDEPTRNELDRIKGRFEQGVSFDFKRYGGMLVLDTIFEDLKTEHLDIKINFEDTDGQNWVCFNLTLPNEAFEEAKSDE